MKTNNSLIPSFFFNDPFIPADRLFDQIFSQAIPDYKKTFGVDALQRASYPKVNIIETDSDIKFIAEVAGLNKDDVEISIKDNEDRTKTLTISGKNNVDKKDDSVKYILRELKQSYFERSFVINQTKNYDFKGVTAKHENGVLTLSIPKIEIEKNEEPKIQYVTVE